MRKQGHSRRSFLAATAAGGMNIALLRDRQALAQGGREQHDEEEDLVERLRQIQVQHPRLHLGGRSVVDLRDRGPGPAAKHLEQLVHWVDRNRDWTPFAGNHDRCFANTVLEEEGAYITNVALAALLTDREEIASLARRHHGTPTLGVIRFAEVFHSPVEVSFGQKPIEPLEKRMPRRLREVPRRHPDLLLPLLPPPSPLLLAAVDHRQLVVT